MKYHVNCPYCGYRLVIAEEGTTIEMVCPKCKAEVSIAVKPDSVFVTKPSRRTEHKALQI
jgi:phage FluMu protein Com